MTVTDVRTDVANLTMTVDATFDAPVERVFEMWADPRLLERWWGPPGWPATFVDHELAPGGRASYFMTGPDGERSSGWWRVVAVEAPHRIEIEDGFADERGNPDPEMPTMRFVVAITPRAGGGTHMAVTTTFPSTEVMEQVISMGVEEGITAAMDQIDGLLRAA